MFNDGSALIDKQHHPRLAEPLVICCCLAGQIELFCESDLACGPEFETVETLRGVLIALMMSDDLWSVIYRNQTSAFFLPFSHLSDRLTCFFPPCAILSFQETYLWSFTSPFHLKLGTLERWLTGRLTDKASCKRYCRALLFTGNRRSKAGRDQI